MDLTNLGQCIENLPAREQVQVHRHRFFTLQQMEGYLEVEH